jgi:uncharacterized protein (TIGR02001 family)
MLHERKNIDIHKENISIPLYLSRGGFSMNMAKTFLITAMCLVLCSSLFTVHLNAGVQVGMDFSSRYIWRGFDLNPENKPVIQPSVTLSLGDSGLSVNFWGSFSFEDKSAHETDITLSYDINTLKDVSLSIGLIHYGWYFTDNFKFKDHTTQELYMVAGLSKVPFKPTLSLYYDVNNGDGLYATLGIEHGLKLSKGMTLDLAASLGYNGGQWVEETGFSDLGISATFPIKLDNVSISPFAGVVFVLLDEVNPGVDNEIYAGVSLAF